MMIPPKKAIDIILSKTKMLAAERVGFAASHGRVLARDIKATTDLPPFTRASVDGFAVRSRDVRAAASRRPCALNIIATVQAGKPFKGTLKPGAAVKIMTGGVVPAGADAVVMKEDTCQQGGKVLISAHVREGHGLCPRGEDVKKGQLIIPAGSRINSGTVALLASLGILHVHVHRQPTVAILVTGNELLPADANLQPGKIRSANEYGLAEQVRQAGGVPKIIGIARDNVRSLTAKLKQGFKADVLLISGGVSAGDYDLVPETLKSLGVKIYIRKIAIQPGKPLLFGKRKDLIVFGLPGNPVATLVSFYNFVWPCLARMTGIKQWGLPQAKAILDQTVVLPIKRHKTVRGVAFERNGRLYVRLSAHMGSGNIISLAKANCLFDLPEGRGRFKKGSPVTVRYLPF